jgi:uncharacterized protein (TIGR03118 family)
MLHPRAPFRLLAGVASAGALLVGSASVASAHQNGGNDYVKIPIVADQPGFPVQDPNVVNAWGLAFGPTTPLWVANNGTNTSTLYNGTTTLQRFPQATPLVVDTNTGGPTGIVFNRTVLTNSPGFKIADGKPALFIFDSEHGDITAWNLASGMKAEVKGGAPGATFKGLTIATNKLGTFLFATDFHNGKVDVFNDHFQQVTWKGAFTDSKIPKGYAPFGIATLKGKVYVTYAKQDNDAKDDVKGLGHGFVDVYDARGRLLQRLVQHGLLDSPWGLAIAPDHFGRFSDDLLVGNFGNGFIHAYSSKTGQFKGTLRDDHNNSIHIDGLWALLVGNGVAGTTNTVIYSAGPQHESHGRVGFLTAKS